MKKLKNKAFTLVELIVVITILAILWTIAFISFQWYSSNARDWVRVADLNSIKKNLELFITEKWFYPTPDNTTNITYSWAVAWSQWTVWDNVMTNLWRINKKPTDPLTNSEYTYSITNAKTEYQLSSITEWWLSYDILLTNQTYAATTKTATAKVVWTYNEKLLKVSTWGIDYILAVPSIINSDLTDSSLQSIINNRKLVYNNYQNLPDSYKNTWYTMTWWFNFAPPSNIIEVYTWSLTNLLNSGAIQQQFITKLQSVYNTTILQSEPIIKEILLAVTPEQQQTLIWNYITNHIWWITGVNTVVTSYLNCEFNWEPVLHSTSVTAYETASVPYLNECTSEQRICTNWILNWSYTFTNCTPDWVTWTFILSQTSVPTWTPVTISNTCSIPPTSYTSSQPSVATVAWTTITTLSAWTTDITPVWWACWDNASKTLTVTAPPFVCGTSTVSAWWYTYNTKVALDWKCRTIWNMKHGTKLTAWTILPSYINTIEKWCYSNDDTNCNTYGWLYTWYEAMWLNSTDTTTTTENTSKSVCWQLGAGWAMPTNAQWTAFTTAWSTWWTWTVPNGKLNWLISSLPGRRNTVGSFVSIASNGFWWSSTRNNTTTTYGRYLYSWDATVNSNNVDKLYGFSVLCLKNN